LSAASPPSCRNSSVRYDDDPVLPCQNAGPIEISRR